MKPVLIMTPLPIEKNALRSALGTLSGVELAVGGHGKVQFALHTLLMLQKFSPRLMLCVGGAGALSADVQPLDIVIGESTVEHDFHLRSVQRPLPYFTGDGAALKKLKAAAPNEKFALHFGAIASGDEDILDRKRAEEVVAATSALAVAWEGAGGARACLVHGTPFLEIRAVTDAADAATPGDFAENLHLGMGYVAEIIQALL